MFSKSLQIITGFIIIFMLCFSGCGTGLEENIPGIENDDGNSHSHTLSDLGMDAQVSECGGFESGTRGLEDENEQCYRKLVWEYDSSSETVSFTDKSIMLNCCGVHTMSIFYNSDADMYEIAEFDDPLEGGLRCKCVCMFDYKIELPDIADDSIKIILTTTVDDYKEIVWEGKLDLTQLNGEVLLDDTGYPCMM